MLNHARLSSKSFNYHCSRLPICSLYNRTHSTAVRPDRAQRHGLASCSACTKLSQPYKRQLAKLQVVTTQAMEAGHTSLTSELPEDQLKQVLDTPVLVWYKNDLRVDDHPGLLAACQAGSSAGVVPVFIFDPEVLMPLLYTPAGPEVLVAALHHLRNDLRQLGSELFVRKAPWDSALTDLAQQVGARTVVAEHEVEHSWSYAAQRVQDSLRSGKGLTTYTWRAPVWQEATYRENYREWQRARGQPLPPLAAPVAVPPLPPPPPPGLYAGDIPTAEELRAMLQHHASVAATGRGGSSGVPAAGEAQSGSDAAAMVAARTMAVAAVQMNPALEGVAGGVLASLASGEERRRAMRVVEAAENGLQMLQAYLGSRNSPSLSPFLKEEVARIESPSTRGASFPALFGPAMAVGAISRRRVHHEATKVRSPSSPEASAAMAAAEGSEFHWQLAARHEERTPVPGATIRYWRWRGSLTDYCVAEPSNPLPGAPSVVLVHGFGAFGDQWRGNLKALADAGYTVYAPTIPGFGRSEKAATSYTQDTWRDFLRDFILQVARTPSVLAGNSIGGFIAASCAADYPALVRGLVLLNSAGPVDALFNHSKWEAAAKAKTPPPRWFVEGLSSALFWYLERTIPGSLKWLYPSDATNADEWLAKEIYRAACDSGSIEVFRAVFYLPPPRALNYMVSELYRGPTLVLQGVLDPLNDARARARQMKELCSNVEVVLVQAGHCPHDEQPKLVNKELIRFVGACSQV